MPSQKQIDERLKAWCELWGSRTAISTGKHALSYQEMIALSTSLAEKIKRYRWTHVMLVPDASSPASLLILFALLQARASVAVADPTWDWQTLEIQCRALGFGVVLAGERHQFQNQDAPEIVKIDDSLQFLAWPMRGSDADIKKSQIDGPIIRFSSGSSGRPKAMEFSTSAVLGAAHAWRIAAAIEETDRIFCLATLNNGLAFNTSVLSCFEAGACLHLYGGLLVPTAIITEIERVRPTVVVGFPFLLELLLKQGARLAQCLESVRLIVSSAAPLSDDVAERWRRITGIPIGQYYGIAEMGPITFNAGSQKNNVGKLLAGVDIKIAKDGPDAGRMSVRTRFGATSYLGTNAERTPIPLDQDGYFRTNDVGDIDNDGYLNIKGTVGRVANIAGRKFNLDDIQTVIVGMQGVFDAYVSSDSTGIEAYVAANGEIDVDAIKMHCLQNLPPILVPGRIRLVQKIPRSASGKVFLEALLSETAKKA